MMMIYVNGASERCNSFFYDKHSMHIFNSQNCVSDFRKKCLSGKPPPWSFYETWPGNSAKSRDFSVVFNNYVGGMLDLAKNDCALSL